MNNLNCLAYSVLVLLLSVSVWAYADSSCSDSLSAAQPEADPVTEKILGLLDFSTPYEKAPADLLPDIESPDLQPYVLAELYVLKYIYQRSDRLQSARIFLERLDQIELLSRLYEHPDIFTRSKGTSITAPANRLGSSSEGLKSLSIVTREAFFLTLLTVANRQPFLILQDTRMIPLLTESFFAPTKEIDVSALPQSYADLSRVRKKILTATHHEKMALLRSPAIKLAARTQHSTDKWNFWLRAVLESNPTKTNEVVALVTKLGIILNPVKLPRGGN